MKIHFVASSNFKSVLAFEAMTSIYGQAKAENAECIVTLSGDGMILRTFHETYTNNIPIYGLNRGAIGFLTNTYSEDNLIERIQKAEKCKIHPLKIITERDNGDKFTSIAINEVYLLRETHQSAKIRISVNGDEKIRELICDGLIASSPIGSTAYNYSANGPIIPVGVKLLALTPISAFRPRGWGGALLKSNSILEFEVIDSKRRPVCAVADYVEFRGISKVKVFEDQSTTLTLLFDEDNNLEKKIMAEQFAT